MQSLYCIDDNSFYNFTGITVYLVYYNWYLIKNNIFCIKFNTHKNTEIWQVQSYKMGTTKQIHIKNQAYYFYNIIDLEKLGY